MKVLISLVLILALATLAGVVTITKAQTGEANNSSSAVLTPPDNHLCGNPVSQTFWAGQTIDVGTLSVWNDQETLYVKYQTIEDWWLTETHLAVAASLEAIPQTKKGNPKVGHFTYQTTYDPAVQEYTYIIDLDEWDADTQLYVAAQADVHQLDENSSVIRTETTWADGDDFAGKNWATYFNYTVQACGNIPAEPGLIDTIETTFFGQDIFVGDVNNDGENELVVGVQNLPVSENTDGQVLIYKYMAGSYSLIWSEDLPNIGWGARAVFIGDTDNDGENELVVGASGPPGHCTYGTIRIYEHTSGNNFTPVWTDNIHCQLIQPGNIYVADSDNDGFNEVVLGISWTGYKLRVYKHAGGNNYNMLWQDNVGSDVHGVAVGDTDNDGENEIVTGNTCGSYYSVMVYEGSSRVWSGGPAVRYHNVSIGDPDNDGQNEIMAAWIKKTGGMWCGTSEGGVAIFEHTAGNNYRLAWQDTPTDARDVSAADVDNDGYNELIASGRYGGVRIYEQNVGNDYSVVWSQPIGNYHYVGDVDNDGQNEFVLSTETGVEIYEQAW